WRGERRDQWEYHWEIYLGKGEKVLGAKLEDFNDMKYWPVFYVPESVYLLELEEAFEAGAFLSSDLIMSREERTLADHDLNYWPVFYVPESVYLLELEEAFEAGAFLSSDLIMSREERTLADHDLKYWPVFAAYNGIEPEELTALIDKALEESKKRK